MYWQCTDESLSPRRKQNHTTKFFTEVTQFYSFILSRRCLRRSGQSRREKNNKICVKIEFYFFSISSKNNVGGSVNHKIKKVWPNWEKKYCTLKLPVYILHFQVAHFFYLTRPQTQPGMPVCQAAGKLCFHFQASLPRPSQVAHTSHCFEL